MKLKNGQNWTRLIMNRVKDMREVTPWELAKEYEGCNTHKISFILRAHGWKKVLPPNASAKNRELRYVRYVND